MEAITNLVADCSSPFHFCQTNVLRGWISFLGQPCHTDSSQSFRLIGLTSLGIDLSLPLALRVCLTIIFPNSGLDYYSLFESNDPAIHGFIILNYSATKKVHHVSCCARYWCFHHNSVTLLPV